MGMYTQLDDVVARIGGRELNSTTPPTRVQVDEWIRGAELELLNTLASVGVPTSFAPGTAGAIIIRDWVADYVAGTVRQANAAAGGAGDNNDGRPLIEDWKEHLKDIRKDPDHFTAKLTGSSTVTGASVLLSSYTSSNPTTDFSPRFTIDEGF